MLRLCLRSQPKDILAVGPDGVLLSNGPGDPAAVDYVVKTVACLIDRSRFWLSGASDAWAGLRPRPINLSLDIMAQIIGKI